MSTDVVVHRYACIEGPYRYWLERQWGAYRPRMTFVMLNPSTADGEVDDPTIRRCMTFANRERCHNLHVLNLFAWRATSPEDLVAAHHAGEDIVGMGNSELLFSLMRDVGPVVVAWGAHPLAVDAGRRLASMAAVEGQMLWCLGTTKGGAPRHPLYVKGDTPLQRWPVAA